MTSQNEPSGSKRGPVRRVMRALLVFVGLVGVIAVPAVACWQTLAAHDSEATNGESAPESVQLPGLADVEDTLLKTYLRLQGKAAQAPVGDDATLVTFTVAPG